MSKSKISNHVPYVTPLISCRQVGLLNNDNLHPMLLSDSGLAGVMYRSTKSMCKIYNHIIKKLAQDGTGSDAHGYIGLQLGYSRGTVLLAFKKFKKYGLLNIIPRKNRSSLYALPECIRHDKTLKNRLSKYFSSLNLVLSVLYLMASPIALSQKGKYSLIVNQTHNTKKKDIYKKYYIPSYISLRMARKPSHKMSVSMGNDIDAQKLTPEERLRIKTEERFNALAKDRTRQEDKMRNKRDENLQALFKKGLITREQLEKILKDRR